MILGIDLGGTKMLLYADNDDKILTERYATGKSLTIDMLNNYVQEFIIKHNLSITAVGIAVPGLVGEGKFVIKSDGLPNLNGLSSDEFIPWLDIPKRLINDVDASAFYVRSLYPSKKAILSIMVGTDVGMGICINGELYTGANGFAGELGAMRMLTKEGEISILDEIAGGRSVLREYGGTPEEVYDGVSKNESRALGVIEQSSYYLGLSIAPLISIFNPDIITIGGGTCAYKGYFRNAEQTIRKYADSLLLSKCEIAQVDSPHIVVLGAIEYVS